MFRARHSRFTPAPGCRRISPAPRSCPPVIDSRQGLPCLFHMGIPQWAYYTNAHTNYYLYFKGIILHITIDKYPNGHYNRPIQDEGAPGSLPNQPGNAHKPANRPAREHTTSGSRWQEIRPQGREVIQCNLSTKFRSAPAIKKWDIFPPFLFHP